MRRRSSARVVAALRGFAEDWLGAFAEWAVEHEETIAIGSGVILVAYRQQGRPVGSIGLVRSRAASVYDWADGAVVRSTTYDDIDDARTAAERLAGSRG